MSGNKRFGTLVTACFQIFLRFLFSVLHRTRTNAIFYAFLRFVRVCVLYETLLSLFTLYIVANFEVASTTVFALNRLSEEGCKIMTWVYVNVL